MFDKRRIVMSLLGVIICAVAVGIFKTAALGVDPFQSLMSGLNLMFPISFGTLYVIANLALLLFSLIADRHNIGIATVLNLTLLGYIAQYSQELLGKMLGQPSLAVRAACLVLGFIVLCFGSSLYMTADLGVSTYDAVANTMAYKWKLGKFKYIRVCTDLSCVILGIGLGFLSGGELKEIAAYVGIGTIATAMCMGPLIDWFNVRIARPLLKEEHKGS